MALRKKKGFVIIRTTKFAGKRKVGIDTNILIRIYDQPYLLDREASRIFNFKDFLFTHVICFFEFAKYLKNKGFNYEEAKHEAKKFLKDNNIKIIYPKKCFIPEKEINSFEEESNRKLNEMGKDYLRCHKPDSIILLAFKKWGINKIYSTDEAFRICSQFLDIDGSGLPSFDKAIRRKLMKNPKFNKRGH